MKLTIILTESHLLLSGNVTTTQYKIHWKNIVLNQIKSILLLFFLGRVLLSIFRVNHNEAMGLIQLANFSVILHDIEGAD